jgi:sigma-B regulation protein RsbU (phosphoserine phosphatase)
VEHDDPSRVLAIVNEVLLYHESGRHCSAALARVRRVGSDWTVTISLAGHPAALVRSDDDVPLAEFGRFGSLLGIFGDPTFFVDTHSLTSSDALVLYTDGVTEARRNDDYFGEHRLHEVLRASAGSAQDVADSVLRSALDFQEGNPRDDIAVVVLRMS